MFQEIKRIVQNCGETSPADRHPQDEDSSWILFEGLNLCHPWAAAGGVDSSDSLIANKATLSAYLCGDGSADDRGQLEVKLDAYCCAPPAACECLASWEDPSTDSRVEVSVCVLAATVSPAEGEGHCQGPLASLMMPESIPLGSGYICDRFRRSPMRSERTRLTGREVPGSATHYLKPRRAAWRTIGVMATAAWTRPRALGTSRCGLLLVKTFRTCTATPASRTRATPRVNMRCARVRHTLAATLAHKPK